ncbi:hypothetical protein C8R48DRAFT_774838 [Suillus tomentosus]|nr:hypothetical protein C8R48DRAFT_774838 [Suillus tomentosus]
MNWRKMVMGGRCSLIPPVGNMEINSISFRMCIGTEKVKIPAPWGDLVRNQSDFIESTYWSADLQLVEPSKTDKADATSLLEFWYQQQQKRLQPTFCFKAWRDGDGDMTEPAKLLR